MANRRRAPQHATPPEGESLWTSTPSSWELPFLAERTLPDLERALDFAQLASEPEDARAAAFRTSVTSEVLSLPTQDRDGSRWRRA